MCDKRGTKLDEAEVKKSSRHIYVQFFFSKYPLPGFDFFFKKKPVQWNKMRSVDIKRELSFKSAVRFLSSFNLHLIY